MQTDFDWQTSEEDELVGSPHPGLPEPTAARRWSWGLIVGIVLVAAAVYGGLRWRAKQQSEAIIADVLIAHQLVQTAVADQDLEKLNLVLSGRELGWQAAQQDLLLNDDFAHRPAFHLQALTASSQPTITLSPNLQEAFVVYDQPYALAEGAEVVLRQTAVYRQGTHNWLLSPPEDAFWGANVVTHTTYFALTYPQRDEALVLSLVDDLEALVFTILCGETTDCFPPQFQLPLQFSPQPHTLLALNNSANWLQNNDPLMLPTPTLVGLPADEAGYQALYRGYGARLTTAVMPYAFDYECCAHGQMLAAFLTKQAHELGLQPWPLSAADYQQLLNFTHLPDDPDELLNIGLEAPSRQVEALALADFITADTGQPARWWLASLLPAGDLTISWPRSVRRQDLSTRWLAYLYAQTGYSAAEPAEDGLLLDVVCREPEGQVYFQYDVETAVWREIAIVPHFGTNTQLWPLPDDDGYLAYQDIRTRFEIEARLTLHYEGRDFIILQAFVPGFNPMISFGFTGQTDPTNRYLLLVEIGPSRYDQRYFLLDFRSCEEDGCPVQTLFGRPAWSPDGAQMILEERPSADNSLTLTAQLQQVRLLRGTGGGENLTAVARGYHPLWLDDEHYLYFRMSDSDRPEIVQANVTDDVPHLWLETADLLSAVPEAERPSTLTITDLVIHSPQQAVVIATATEGNERTYYLFRWQPEAPLQLLHQMEHLMTTSFATNGRWLTLTQPNGSVTLLNTSSGEYQPLDSPNTLPNWTADGQWLLTSRANYLLLTQPESSHQQIVFNSSANCHQLNWAQ